MYFTAHAEERMRQRQIDKRDVLKLLANAKSRHIRECWDQPGSYQVRGDNTNLLVLVSKDGGVLSTYREGVPD